MPGTKRATSATSSGSPNRKKERTSTSSISSSPSSSAFAAFFFLLLIWRLRMFCTSLRSSSGTSFSILSMPNLRINRSRMWRILTLKWFECSCDQLINAGMRVGREGSTREEGRETMATLT